MSPRKKYNVGDFETELVLIMQHLRNRSIVSEGLSSKKKRKSGKVELSDL